MLVGQILDETNTNLDSLVDVYPSNSVPPDKQDELRERGKV